MVMEVFCNKNSGCQGKQFYAAYKFEITANFWLTTSISFTFSFRLNMTNIFQSCLLTFGVSFMICWRLKIYLLRTRSANFDIRLSATKIFGLPFFQICSNTSSSAVFYASRHTSDQAIFANNLQRKSESFGSYGNWCASYKQRTYTLHISKKFRNEIV
jgi:hypothetical protein